MRRCVEVAGRDLRVPADRHAHVAGRESNLVLGAIELLLGGLGRRGVKDRRMTDIDNARRHFFERCRAADDDLDRRRASSSLDSVDTT
jgi:hypothetical protein